MSYVIARVIKVKSTAIGAMQYHNDRAPGEHLNPDIDPERTHLNYELHDAEGCYLPRKYAAEVDAKIAANRASGRKVRKDAVKLDEPDRRTGREERREPRIVVAEQAGEVVACATGLIDRRPPAPDSLTGWCGWVQSVVVVPACRRQGIAERLMRELLQWFAGRGATKVLLETTPDAEALYRKLGFARSQEGLLSFVGDRP